MRLQAEFKSKLCKSHDHGNCAGHWIGLGIEVSCDCPCHSDKIDSPAQVALDQRAEQNEGRKDIITGTGQ